LNLAASDVFFLHEGLTRFYAQGDTGGLHAYSDRALARIWGAMRFSWQTTMMLHRFPEHSAYERRMQDAELAHLMTSEAAQRAWAENYIGLPY
jgi:p-hydroxybenzoate 3-monooxygenase